MKVRAYDWIAHHAHRTPRKLATIELHTGRRLTYTEFDDRIARLAGFLTGELGVEPGDRVAVLSPNSVNVFELQFACWRSGAVLTPLNWRLALPELEYIVHDSTPKVLFYDPEHETPARALGLRAIGWGDSGSEYENAVSKTSPVRRASPPWLNDTAAIMYTAGTTGRPKGALITHAMTFYNAVNIGMAVDLTSQSVCLVVLPTFHTGGLNLYANPTFHLGGTVAVMRAFEPEVTLRLLGDRDLRVTHFFGVPSIYLFMSQHPSFEGTDLSRLVATGIGGAPAPLSLLETWAARGRPLMQGFGMTETSPTALVLGADRALDKVGSCGLPVLHTEVRLVDKDGRDVAVGELGELWVRGPNVSSGYWHRPDANAESFTDGWLHTGDAARQDDEGYFYIVDRWKDMYISGGENVYPAEVENVIYQLPAVAEVAVIGVPDEKWGEVGRACVVLKPDSMTSEGTIIEHCRANLARYKVPKSVVFIAELPRNAAGKVLKRELALRFGA
jgi:fatty-acyl-CoA synthase